MLGCSSSLETVGCVCVCTDSVCTHTDIIDAQPTVTAEQLQESPAITNGSWSTNAVYVCLCVQTSETLVRVRPCSSRALCLLGDAQLTLYNCHVIAASRDTASRDAAELLEDAKQSFSASIAHEGTAAVGEPSPHVTGNKQLQHDHPAVSVSDITKVLRNYKCVYFYVCL